MLYYLQKYWLKISYFCVALLVVYGLIKPNSQQIINTTTSQPNTVALKLTETKKNKSLPTFNKSAQKHVNKISSATFNKHEFDDRIKYTGKIKTEFDVIGGVEIISNLSDKIHMMTSIVGKPVNNTILSEAEIMTLLAPIYSINKTYDQDKALPLMSLFIKNLNGIYLDSKTPTKSLQETIDNCCIIKVSVTYLELQDEAVMFFSSVEAIDIREPSANHT